MGEQPPGVGTYHERLRRAGWSARELSLLTEAGRLWQVTVAKGDDVLYRNAADRHDAWAGACGLARVADLLDALCRPRG